MKRILVLCTLGLGLMAMPAQAASPVKASFQLAGALGSVNQFLSEPY
jgi:hypothetical protein